jgi:hypothetical protein
MLDKERKHTLSEAINAEDSFHVGRAPTRRTVENSEQVLGEGIDSSYSHNGKSNVIETDQRSCQLERYGSAA